MTVKPICRNDQLVCQKGLYEPPVEEAPPASAYVATTGSLMPSIELPSNFGYAVAMVAPAVIAPLSIRPVLPVDFESAPEEDRLSLLALQGLERLGANQRTVAIRLFQEAALASNLGPKTPDSLIRQALILGWLADEATRSSFYTFTPPTNFVADIATGSAPLFDPVEGYFNEAQAWGEAAQLIPAGSIYHDTYITYEAEALRRAAITMVSTNSSPNYLQKLVSSFSGLVDRLVEEQTTPKNFEHTFSVIEQIAKIITPEAYTPETIECARAALGLHEKIALTVHRLGRETTDTDLIIRYRLIYVSHYLEAEHIARTAYLYDKYSPHDWQQRVDELNLRTARISAIHASLAHGSNMTEEPSNQELTRQFANLWICACDGDESAIVALDQQLRLSEMETTDQLALARRLGRPLNEVGELVQKAKGLSTPIASERNAHAEDRDRAHDISRGPHGK